jgi:hypothetical protein
MGNNHKYVSNEERLCFAVSSLLRVAYAEGKYPRGISRDFWSRKKKAGEISKQTLSDAGITWGSVREKACTCLPLTGDFNNWPQNFPLEAALEEVWHVVYKKPRKVKLPKVAVPATPATPGEKVETLGKNLEIRELKQENKELLKELAVLQERFDLMVDLKKASTEIPVLSKRVETRTGSLRQGIAKVLVSDFHLEEKIDPAQVNGCNEYNPLIARARLEKLAEGVIWKIQTHRSMYDIQALIIEFLGDLITGYLHLDNLLTNYLSPFEAVLECKDALIQFILLILEEAELEEVIVNCVCGNHGRNFEKVIAKNFIRNSFEWLIFQLMQEQLAFDERIKFNIATGEHLYTRVYDQVHRGYHGTAVSYRGGLGRATVPLYSALKEWDKLIKANMTCIGHLHTFLAHPEVIMNGSICGFNEYAQSKKFGYEEPQQVFMLIDSHRGVRDVVNIWLSQRFDHQMIEV